MTADAGITSGPKPVVEQLLRSRIRLVASSWTESPRCSAGGWGAESTLSAPNPTSRVRAPAVSAVRIDVAGRAQPANAYVHVNPP